MKGERATTSYSLGRGMDLENLGQVDMPNSLGLLYEQVTSYLGFLHSSFLHTGTRVAATLVSRTGDAVRFPGKVVRCAHVTRHIHDVGV